MNSKAVKKIHEGAYFIVDTLGYFNQITPFDLALATQTISSLPSQVPIALEIPEPSPSDQ